MYFVGVLLAFAREAELCPFGVTLSLLCILSFTMCCSVTVLSVFCVPFPNGMNFEINNRHYAEEASGMRKQRKRQKCIHAHCSL